jgi:hypothetical protein
MKQIDSLELDEYKGEPPFQPAVHTAATDHHRHNHANPPNAQMHGCSSPLQIPVATRSQGGAAT